MSESHRVLVLALDAANPSLLRQWSADGTLPNIARAMAKGLVAGTRGPEGMEVGATWPTFYTGLNPASHGICWTDRVIPGTYRQQKLGKSDVNRLTPFWRTLSAAGKRVIILDVPFTPPIRGINGVQLVEWGVHDGIYNLHSFPRPLARHIRATYGTHPPPSNCDSPRLDAAGYRDLRDKMVRGVELRGAMTRELLAAHDWDFALQVFNENHCSGHLLWHYHDTGHPAHDPATVARDGDLLRDVYMATDREVGKIMAGVSDDTLVMILSLHGMEHVVGSSLLLPDILVRLGALTTASGRGPRPVDGSTPPPRRKAKGFRGVLRALVPEAVRMPLYQFRQWINRRWLLRGEPIDIDSARTKAFPMGFGTGTTYSGIRLNLRGREPAGTLSRGAEEERFVEELREGLTELVNPETGWPLVKRLVRTEELHRGNRLDDLPDLLVEWSYDPGRGNTSVGDGKGGIWRGYSDRIGMVEHPNGSARTGVHRLEGLLVATGPGIAPGTLDRVIHGMDFAPTIMAMFGIQLRETDGQVIHELVTRESK